MAGDVEKRQSGGLGIFHGVALVAVAAVGVIVAFVVLHAIAGIVWELVKVAIVLAVIGAVLWLILGRRR